MSFVEEKWSSESGENDFKEDMGETVNSGSTYQKMLSNKVVKSSTADFLTQNNPFKKPKKREPCMFHQDSKFKFTWDLIMTVLLFIICVCMPIHLAFKSEDVYWCWTYFSIDILFVIDMCFTFFTTIPEKEDEEELTDRKEIAK